jgi:trehalose 6-phosphate phosphatase
MSDGRAAGASNPLPIALFTDFDGTLIEIADTPDGVVVPGELVGELTRVAETLDDALVVVSGREIGDIDNLLQPLVLPVAGSHGAHRRRADGAREDVPGELVGRAATIAERLAPLVADDPRLLLERKEGAVALHYRRAPERAEECRIAMHAAIAGMEEFRLLEGKMVLEARPASFDKGNVVRAYMAEPPFNGRVPLFIGDDTTDEDGFRAVQELGGVGIKIGPGPTAARGRLPDVASARRLMRRIAEGRPFAAPERKTA